MLGDYAYGSYFFFFIFLFAFLRCVHIHLLQIFLFLLNVLVLNARTVFTVLRIHGILEWLDCCLPTLMLVSLIHEKSYRWWSHSSNDDIFFLFSFFSFAKIQTRLPSAFAVQFSTWIKKTVHVSRRVLLFFLFSFILKLSNARTNYFSCALCSLSELETKRKRNPTGQW